MAVADVDLWLYFQVLEVLYKSKMSATFGMAALIITPTRELAFQIFEVLNKIRGHHDFSANLIIGGKVGLFLLLSLHQRTLSFEKIKGNNLNKLSVAKHKMWYY